jgi:geranylgeranyl reductase family protein
MADYDTVIIGAGPIGCYCAARLAEEGFSVAVAEKEAAAKRPVCTGVIGVEAFDEFDLPRDAIISTIKDITLFSPSRAAICYRPRGPQAHVVDRAVFDGVLKMRARNAGAEFLTGFACSDIRIRDDRAEIQGSGRAPSLRARVVVVASGFNPRLTSKLNLGGIADRFEGVQADAVAEQVAATEIYIGRNVAPHSFAWVVPLMNGGVHVGLMTRKNAVPFLAQFLDALTREGRIRAAGEISRKIVPYGQLGRTYTERAIVVGEAAGQVKSTTHGGIYYGLISARCAVETIGEAFREGRFDAPFMRRYETRWRAALESELARGAFLRKVFSRLNDNHMEKIFDLASKNGIMAGLHEKARFDWHAGIISFLEAHPLLKTYFGELLQRT